MSEAWKGFTGGLWQDEINVRDFIQRNYTAYEGGKEFLAGPTDATEKLWGELQKLQAEERKKGQAISPAISAKASRTLKRSWACRPTSR